MVVAGVTVRTNLGRNQVKVAALFFEAGRKLPTHRIIVKAREKIIKTTVSYIERGCNSSSQHNMSLQAILL